jgi:hypothetical protein
VGALRVVWTVHGLRGVVGGRVMGVVGVAVVAGMWVVGVAKVFGVWVRGYGGDSEGWWW